MPPGPTAVGVLLLVALSSCLASCRAGGLGDEGAADVASVAAAPAPWRPPPHRGGPRFPAFAGPAPQARGWVQVRGLLWVEGGEAARYARGQVFEGRRWVDREAAGALAVPAESGYLLRADHVSLRTNVAWDEAEALAGEAEGHVRRLFGRYGEALDLRFPAGPLPVIVHARRDAFARALAEVAASAPGWAAFYAAASGAVHVSTEPAPAGALPLVADLRHEMTHQLLDLCSPRPGRVLPVPHHLWLWEGFAVTTETLGDPEGATTNAARRARFEARRERGELEPLAALFALDVRSFEGRHYDQAGDLVAFLLADGVAGGRRAALATLADLLAGRAARDGFLRHLGMSAADLEARWRGGS